MGPAPGKGGVNDGPHPHIGLQTVTRLFDGEVLHRDSLGSEQLIRPGQLNLMTAGHGVSHAEEAPSGSQSGVHGMQLWVAQSSSTRDGDPAFEHHADLPLVELAGCRATVLVGSVAGKRSLARTDTDHFGAELTIDRRSAIPLEVHRERGHDGDDRELRDQAVGRPRERGHDRVERRERRDPGHHPGAEEAQRLGKQADQEHAGRDEPHHHRQRHRC